MKIPESVRRFSRRFHLLSADADTAISQTDSRHAPPLADITDYYAIVARLSEMTVNIFFSHIAAIRHADID